MPVGQARAKSRRAGPRRLSTSHSAPCKERLVKRDDGLSKYLSVSLKSCSHWRSRPSGHMADSAVEYPFGHETGSPASNTCSTPSREDNRLVRKSGQCSRSRLKAPTIRPRLGTRDIDELRARRAYCWDWGLGTAAALELRRRRPSRLAARQRLGAASPCRPRTPQRSSK